MLRTGQRAPDFELPGALGGSIEPHSLSSYTDSGWPVVVVFYPFDFHPACVSRLCALRDAEWLAIDEDVVVLGVSTDGAYSHRAFAESERIDFPLLSDADGSVARAYGVLAAEFEGHREVAEQSIFVVDPDRTVQYAWVGEGPEDGPDFEAIANASRCVGERCDLDRGVVVDGDEE